MKIQVAKKDHKCTDCGKTIPKGHRYWRDYKPVDDTPGYDRKTHTNCEEYKNANSDISRSTS